MKLFKQKQTDHEGAQLMKVAKLISVFRNYEREGQAQLMREAYEAVFRTGRPSVHQRVMVLADLANKSGFYRVSRKTGDGNNIAYASGVEDGKREVFGHIYNFLRLSMQEKADLESGARTDWLKIANSNDADLRRRY